MLNKFVLNSEIRLQNGTVPATPGIADRENQEPNENRSQDDPHLEVTTPVNRFSQSFNSDPDTVHCKFLFIIEVSESFSADPFWVKNYQHCSGSNSVLYFTWKSLNSVDFFWKMLIVGNTSNGSEALVCDWTADDTQQIFAYMFTAITATKNLRRTKNSSSGEPFLENPGRSFWRHYRYFHLACTVHTDSSSAWKLLTYSFEWSFLFLFRHETLCETIHAINFCSGILFLAYNYFSKLLCTWKT